MGSRAVQVCRDLGEGGVRGDDPAALHHHQEEHLHEAHQLSGGRVLERGGLWTRLLSVLARLGLGQDLHGAPGV